CRCLIETRNLTRGLCPNGAKLNLKPETKKQKKQHPKMQLFYHPDINVLNQEVAFSKEESRHIIKVLRKTTGDNLMVTNGKGYMYEGEIILENPHKCVIKIISET